jgi:3-oxoacyl-[acyl-carrier-protein] synthase II
VSDVVVTGLGAVTPLGLDAPTTWDGLVAGRSGVVPISLFDASELAVRIAGEVPGFDPESFLGPTKTRRTARFSQRAIAAAREAVADAGLDVAADPGNVGVLVNCAVAGVPEAAEATEALVAQGPRGVSPTYVPMTATGKKVHYQVRAQAAQDAAAGLLERP